MLNNIYLAGFVCTVPVVQLLKGRDLMYFAVGIFEWPSIRLTLSYRYRYLQ
jgi:hypothetical protein